MSYISPEQAVQAKAAWTMGVELLVLSGVPERKARVQFGGVLSKYRIRPWDLLPALETAQALGTMDGLPWLVKAAQRAQERYSRQDAALKCAWG